VKVETGSRKLQTPPCVLLRQMPKKPVRNRAGIRVSHRATWISVFRGKRQHGGQGSEIQESWANQSCLRNPALGGATTYSEDDDKALGVEVCWHECRAWRWPLLHLEVCRTTYARVLEKVRPPGTGTLQPARSRSNPRRCGHPRLCHHR
jgi:hypothetical protein